MIFFTAVGPSLAKNPSEIDVIMNDMKNSAPGHDGITLNILKLSFSSIKTRLTHILNFSLSEGVFPVGLKIGKVILLFTADDPMLFHNYRPVSLLCVR